jgi:hypothetical protein
VTRRRLLLLALLAFAFVPSGPARAESTPASTTDEAWYATPPTCGLPTGCGPTESLPPISRYPAGTLHVGVTGGLEDSRTYLKLDLTGVPSDATLTGGTLTLPIASAADGTSSPETAQVAACFVGAPFAPAEGSVAPPPAVDCSTSVAATFAPGPPALLTVDLSAFAARWGAGEANNGLALLPAPGAAPGTTWHVAFSAKTRTGSDVPPARAELDYDSAAAPVTAQEPVPDVIDNGSEAFGPLGGFFVTPVPAPSPAAAIVTQSKLPARIQPAAVIGGPGFAYPVLLALPLLLLGLGGYLGWALTRPVAVAQS